MKHTREEIIKEYGVAPMVGTLQPSSLDDHARTSTRSGLVWDQAWLYTVVTSAEGQKYLMVRGYEKSLTGMWMSSKLNPDLKQVSSRIFKQLYSGPIDFDLYEEEEMARIKSLPSKHNFQVDLYRDHLRWQEENEALDLQFNTLGPGMRFSDFGTADHENLVYTCEMFEVKGTLNGEAVSGFGGLDQAWLPPGIGWGHCIPYNYIEDSWITWATRYDDGSVEYGVNAIGAGDWRFAFFVRNGEAYINPKNGIDLTWDNNNDVRIPLAADIQHGEHNLKWVADGRSAIVKGRVNWISGKTFNTAKKATPVETFSIHEFRAH